MQTILYNSQEEQDYTIEEYSRELINFLQSKNTEEKIYYDLSHSKDGSTIILHVFYKRQMIRITTHEFTLISLEYYKIQIEDLIKGKLSPYIQQVKALRWFFYTSLIKLDNIFNKHRHNF